MGNDSIIMAFQPTGLRTDGLRTDGGSTNNIVPFYRRPQGVNPGPSYPPPSLTGSAVNKFPIPPSGGQVPSGSLAIPTNQASSPYWASNAVRLDTGATAILVRCGQNVEKTCAFIVNPEESRNIDLGYTMPPGLLVPESSFEDPRKVGNVGYTHYAHRVQGSYSRTPPEINLNFWGWASKWELTDALRDPGITLAMANALQKLVNKHKGNFDAAFQEFAGHFDAAESLVLENKAFFKALVVPAASTETRPAGPRNSPAPLPSERRSSALTPEPAVSPTEPTTIPEGNPAVLRSLTTQSDALRQALTEINQQLKQLQHSVPSRQEITAESGQWRDFSGKVAALQRGIERLQDQAAQALTNGEITFEQYERLSDPLVQQTTAAYQLNDRFLKAKAYAYTRAVQATEAAIKNQQSLPYGADIKTYQELSNYAQWYSEKAGLFNFSPTSRQGFMERVGQALKPPPPEYSGARVPASPVQRQKQELKRWEEAKQEADRIIRELHNKFRLRPPTAQELQEAITSDNPIVRSFVEKYFEKGDFSGGNISFEMAKTIYKQAVEQGKAWLKSKGIDLDHSNLSNQHIAVFLMQPTDVPATQAPGIASDVWTAIHASGRAEEVKGITREIEALQTDLQNAKTHDELLAAWEAASSNNNLKTWQSSDGGLWVLSQSLIRLGPAEGQSLAGHTFHQFKNRDTKVIEALARAINQPELTTDRLARLGGQVLAKLKENVIYRRSLGDYYRGVNERQTPFLGSQTQNRQPIIQLTKPNDIAAAVLKLGQVQNPPPDPQNIILGADGLPIDWRNPFIYPPPPRIETPISQAPLIEIPSSVPTSPLFIDRTGQIPDTAFEPSAIYTGGKHLFVIPDVHGNSDLLRYHIVLINQQMRALKLDPKDIEVVFLGDYINKGHNPWGVVEIARGMQPVPSSAISVLNANFQNDPELQRALLDLLGSGVTCLRGNHEDFKTYAMHMTINTDLHTYGKHTGDVLGKGLDNTVRSYYPEMSDEDKAWFEKSLNRYPFYDSTKSEWRWKGKNANSSEPSPTTNEVEEFYNNFRTRWVKVLENTGHLGFFMQQLVPVAQLGNTFFMHGSPPITEQEWVDVEKYLSEGTPLPLDTQRDLMWRRGPTSLDYLERAASSRPWRGDAVTFNGHTMGGGSGDFTTDNGTTTQYYLDMGFGLNRLVMGVVLPNGLMTFHDAERTKNGGVQTNFVLPSGVLRGLGGGELPNRFIDK
jgi:hypothetical protein